MSLKALTLSSIIVLSIFFSCKNQDTNPTLSISTTEEIFSEKKYISDYLPINDDSTINVIIEIPAGTHAKWEVDKKDEVMRLQYVEGAARMIDYLSYPANYGMIPQSLLPKDKGGDGDPLDVIVLGRRIERAQIVRCRLIGILRLLDNGEQDDKLIAVPIVETFSDINDLKELQERYPGVTTIIETWFTNYKGPDEMISLGFGDKQETIDLLNYAIENYSKYK